MGTVVHTGLANEAHTLILHWDGVNWTQIASPDVGGLNAVAAINENDVWAIGDAILHWDGHNWTQVAKPPAILHAIAAVGSNDLWAVGEGPLIMHWDGKSWRTVSSPQPPLLADYIEPHRDYLTSITAIAPNDLWAVGSQVGSISDSKYPYRNVMHTLVMHWDGQSWSIVPSPNDSLSQSFIDIAAISQDELWAVGEIGSDNPSILIARFHRKQCPR
jgi:hypothetical protein